MNWLAVISNDTLKAGFVRNGNGFADESRAKKTNTAVLSLNQGTSAPLVHNDRHIRRQGIANRKPSICTEVENSTKAEIMHFCPAFVYAMLAVVLKKLRYGKSIENKTQFRF
jgi:hypothetical protein